MSIRLGPVYRNLSTQVSIRSPHTSPACKSIRVLLHLVNGMPPGRNIMKRILRLLLAFACLVSLVSPLLADTIRLKDGSVIRGRVVGFKDQQFTIAMGGGTKGRRGQTI